MGPWTRTCSRTGDRSRSDSGQAEERKGAGHRSILTRGVYRTAEGLTVHGEIDLATAESFEERAREAVMDTRGSSVLIDLSGVTFMDSAGMRALIRVMELRCGKSLIVQPSRRGSGSSNSSL
jgi:anti-anti-sigma factor